MLAHSLGAASVRFVFRNMAFRLLYHYTPECMNQFGGDSLWVGYTNTSQHYGLRLVVRIVFNIQPYRFLGH